MVLNTATVLGSSVSHLQDATLALVESTHKTQEAKACLEIQVEYSSNLKLIAQALQSGITPLGILRNAFDGVNTEQVDISSCLHFVSKVMCLPGQDKVIYHSCFHNHSSCHARQLNLSQINDFPWDMWTSEIKKDKGLLDLLTKQLKEA
ncbi:uncharacterized protein ACNLHF_016701 [Anomaloglossus baeobatrachus]